MKIHLIAIGGSVMHNLAIALHKIGHEITGSDDEIYNPAKDRLSSHGLLPSFIGWDTSAIHAELDVVILGMHARKDNPELLKAQQLNLSIYSYPEFIYYHSRNKLRIAVTGSHGKTTTTSMLMHGLKKLGKKFDYLVGAQLDGFDTMVQLSDAPIMVIEGDEYTASPLDTKPKFLHYRPNITILTGIAWDHVNVFPTFDSYLKQFILLLEQMDEDALLVYYEKDENIQSILKFAHCKLLPYSSETDAWNKISNLYYGYPLRVFGEHNLANMEAARLVLNKLGIDNLAYASAMQNFSGAAKRLELLRKTDNQLVYLDFAHAPSKVKATTLAVSTQYPSKDFWAFLELHTFSSLNKQFLKEYAHSLATCSRTFVFFNPASFQHKRLEPYTTQDVIEAFEQPNLVVINQTDQLQMYLLEALHKSDVCLLMSSGNWGGVDVKKLVAEFNN